MGRHTALEAGKMPEGDKEGSSPSPSGSSPITFEVPKVQVSNEKCPGVHFHKPSGHFPEVEGP